MRLKSGWMNFWRQPSRAAFRLLRDFALSGLVWGIAAMAATLLLLVGGGAGFMLGHSPPAVVSSMSGPDRWLRTVAEQMSLYSAGTLAHVEVNAANEQARLARLGAEMNLSLSPEAVTLPGLALKRVDVLQVDHRPLLQLVYQGEGTGPRGAMHHW